jgi:hypothetical protein
MGVQRVAHTVGCPLSSGAFTLAMRALDLAGLMAFLSKSQSRKLLSLMNRM